MKFRIWRIVGITVGLMILMIAHATAERAYLSGSGRVMLRTAPSLSSDAIGEFYSGTPVLVLSGEEDGYVRIQIGTGSYSVHGYVETEEVSSSESRDTTYDAETTSPYGTPTVVLRSRPSNSYEPVASVSSGTGIRVIGSAGSYLFIMLRDGTVGCLDHSEIR